MTLRLGLVGHGRWGRNIERTLLPISDVSLTIVAKGDRPQGLDGVLIATQSAHHANAALPYIEAGVATFIEKPMTTTIADATRIRDAAKRSGAVVFIGHIFLCHPAFLTALKLLQSLGTIRYVLYDGMNNNPREDSSVLWDWLPHALSMTQSIFGREPESVTAWNLSGGAHAQAALSKFQYGETSMVAVTSWLSPVPRMQLTVVCENGTLLFDDEAERKLTLYSNNGERIYPSYSNELPLTSEMNAFLSAVRSGNPDPDQIELGCAIVRAIVSAQESAGFSGKSVEV